MAATSRIENRNDEVGQKRLICTFTAQNDEVKFQPRRPRAMSVQATGAFTTSTVDIQASNDDTTYASLPTAVSLSAVGIKSIALADLGFAYYKVIMLAASESHGAIVSWVENV